MDVHYRLCCGAPGASPALSETVDGQSTWNGPVVDLSSPQTIVRDFSTARHEAAHAVIAHSLGLSVKSVHIDPVGICRLVKAPGDRGHSIAFSVAGPLSDAMRGGWRMRTGTLDFEIVSRRVLACWGGHCDDCQAVRTAHVIAGSGNPTHAFRILRRIERQVVDFLRNPEVEEAVEKLAVALMSAGTVGGEGAHEILGRHVAPGSLTLTNTR
ncbi:MAG: hypothetical protein E5X34_29785 [Mesorhizobium sp.]|uniref:hypothetical protein n=1 Tax=Mesorhizobium sp. TaxID=1871066 RepID=UPI001218EF57|nr:hypothetical protein [Mesorhizobium sp.]TIR15287.1 MAG: hypothetical protein E5X34_29785 [Mesorhizobium sp.]